MCQARPTTTGSLAGTIDEATYKSMYLLTYVIRTANDTIDDNAQEIIITSATIMGESFVGLVVVVVSDEWLGRREDLN